MKVKNQSAYRVAGRQTVPFLIVVFTSVLTWLVTAILQRETVDLIRNTILAIVGSGCISFLLIQGGYAHTFLYDNEDHLWRFFFFYFCSLVMSLLFAFLPVTGWPFLVISIALSLFGSETIGVVASAVLIGISSSIAGAPCEIFLMYLISGVVAILCFRRIDSAFHIFMPALCSFLVLIVLHTACIILYVNERLGVGLFVLPVIGLFVNGILLVIVLRYLESSVVNRYRMTFMEINDQEYALMAELRQNDKDAYFTAIHTGYLCERVANSTGLDAALCKSGGYYHKLADCPRKEREELFEKLQDKHHFPPAVLKLLDECNRPEHRFVTPEAAVVHMADAVVTSIRYLFQNNPEAEVQYDQVIRSLFDRKVRQGMFDDCDITFAQFQQMKKLFLEEKLYYDFLR